MPNDRVTKRLTLLLSIACLFAASGATCQRQLLVNPFAAPGPAAPMVLLEGATREQIIAAVNLNSSRIRSMTATGATISVPGSLGIPLLSGNLAAERPGRFRLTAGTAVSGQELDLGSNDELFWLWIRRNQPPGVYYCRHAQFANSNIRQMMPVEPAWLLAALGMVDIDPAGVIDGPIPSTRGVGTLELRTWLASTSGPLQRVLVIDARRAWVVEQHVYDQAGQTLLASAVAESHRYYPVEQVSLPEVLSLRLPPANLALKINLGIVQLNAPPTERAQTWVMPTFDGSPQYDLGGAALGTPLPGQTLGHPLSGGLAPSLSPNAPAAPYPVTPASNSNAAPSSSFLTSPTREPGPLPLYGSRATSTRR
ncbi:MAG: hypothetical protein IT425_10870 [Pirellulales bacterium]|nr:hypothetical protein [Pirellulales bacterium]